MLFLKLLRNQKADHDAIFQRSLEFSKSSDSYLPVKNLAFQKHRYLQLIAAEP
jgi:hypothetical protein